MPEHPHEKYSSNVEAAAHYAMEDADDRPSRAEIDAQEPYRPCRTCGPPIPILDEDEGYNEDWLAW